MSGIWNLPKEEEWLNELNKYFIKQKFTSVSKYGKTNQNYLSRCRWKNGLPIK